MKKHLALILLLAALLLVALFVVSRPAAAADDDMKKLSASRGCDICHMTLPRTGDAVTPPAPSFRDIARRYRGRPGAEDRLVASVLQGAGGGQNRHWAGKARFDRMPPNVVEINEVDARKLVRWILR